MGLFAKLFQKKNKDVTTAENTIPVLNTNTPNLELYEKLVNIIVVSETLKADLKSNLKQAFESPKLFYDDQDDFILSERGLSFPEDTLTTLFTLGLSSLIHLSIVGKDFS